MKALSSFLPLQSVRCLSISIATRRITSSFLRVMLLPVLRQLLLLLLLLLLLILLLPLLLLFLLLVLVLVLAPRRRLLLLSAATTIIITITITITITTTTSCCCCYCHYYDYDDDDDDCCFYCTSYTPSPPSPPPHFVSDVAPATIKTGTSTDTSQSSFPSKPVHSKPLTLEFTGLSPVPHIR